MKKYFISSLLTAFACISAFAQNSPGADYLSLGEIKLAKDHFMKTIRQTPAESYYYLGEIAFMEGNLAEAKKNYEAGLAGNPEATLCAVGLAKLELKSNSKAAEDQLKDIQKKAKKDVPVILAIAKAYLDNGMKEKAMEKLQDARKADKKNPYIYIFEGDMLAKENKPGDAAMQYDQAVNFDPSCVLAYLKSAQVYEFINRQTAIDKLKEAIKIAPEYKLAYRELAEVLYRDGFYPEAIAAYKEFVSGGDYAIEDLTRYAASEYFTQGYDAAKKLISEGLAKDANSFVLNRLSMYVNNDLKDYQAGLAAGDKFFSIPLNPQDTTIKYLPQDFMAYAKILSETGSKPKALEQYQKAAAIEKNPEKATALNKELATVCADESMYPEAAGFYKKFIEMSGEAASAQDYFQMGRYYYMAGDAAKKDTVSVAADQAAQNATALYKEADAAFATVAERIPDSYMGNFWRARVNAAMDPETTAGLAKPYYEKTSELIVAKADGENHAQLIEAYTYLSYFYYLQFDKSKKAEDKEMIKSYSEKILALNPENGTAKQLLDFASGK